jgi:hypothetical protein
LQKTSNRGERQKKYDADKILFVGFNVVPPTIPIIGDPRMLENHEDSKEDLYIIKEEEPWFLRFCFHENDLPPLNLSVSFRLVDNINSNGSNLR